MMQLTTATLGLSMSLSVVTTYSPLLLADFTDSATLIGLAIGGEGVFGIGIPLLFGYLSDRIWTRWGRRRPFMIFAAPVMAVALALAPFQPSFALIVAATFVFFGAYHAYTAPYQSLIPDVVPLRQQGRVQGAQNFMRGIGMFLGMMLGGVLLDLWRPLPFLAAGAVMMLATYVTVARIGEVPPEAEREDVTVGFRDGLVELWRTASRATGIRWFLAANFLWEFTIAGIRPFIMLYFLFTLGAGTSEGALLLGVVGVVHVAAAIGSGALGDRFGRVRVMWAGLVIYLAGCLIGFFLRDLRLAFLLLPVFGLGGSTVLTLPYAIFVGFMPSGQFGRFTGLFVTSRALAILVAPIVAGGAIDLLAPYLPATRGYNVIWLVAAGAVVLSMGFLRRAVAAQPAGESI
ncbi:MAG: MFS transporter [Thermoleophilia bacterium]